MSNDFGTELLQNLDLEDNYYGIDNMQFDTAKRFIITCIYKLKNSLNPISFSRIKMLMNFKVK